jgi:hypothetical protein
MQRFEIHGIGHQDDTTSVEITCDRCSWYFEPETSWPALADLVQRADEHTEACP